MERIDLQDHLRFAHNHVDCAGCQLAITNLMQQGKGVVSLDRIGNEIVFVDGRSGRQVRVKLGVVSQMETDASENSMTWDHFPVLVESREGDPGPYTTCFAHTLNDGLL